MRKIKNLLSNFYNFLCKCTEKSSQGKLYRIKRKKKNFKCIQLIFSSCSFISGFFLLSTFNIQKWTQKRDEQSFFLFQVKFFMIFFQGCELLVQFRIENCIQVQCTLCCCFYSASIRAIEWNFYAESIASFSTRLKPNQLTHHHLISDSTTCYFALATSNMHQSF